MKAKQFVTLCFVLGLAMVVTGFVGSAVAESELSSASSEGTGPVSEGLAGPVEVEDVAPAASLPLAAIRVAGSVFKPRNSSVGWASTGGGGSIYASSGSPSETWNVPVYLPQGSIVDRIRMYYYDTSSSNCMGWFTVYDLNGNIVDEWSVTSSGSGGNGYNDSDPINHTINYTAFSYVLNWRPLQLGTTMRLNGFRIFYRPSGTRYGSALILSEPPP
jgi:hypothetical protein